MKKIKKQQDIKSMFEELENIAQWFETSDVDLQIGLQKYERGMELIKNVKSQLKDVENKIKKVSQDQGSFKDIYFFKKTYKSVVRIVLPTKKPRIKPFNPIDFDKIYPTKMAITSPIEPIITGIQLFLRAQKARDKS